MKMINNHIDSDDFIIREFISSQSVNFPLLEPDIVIKQLNYILASKQEMKDTMLPDVNKHRVTEDALPILLKLLSIVPKARQHTLIDIIHALPLDAITTHEQSLRKYVGRDVIRFCRQCATDDEERLWRLYGATLKQLEEKYNHTLFIYGKKLLAKLIEKGYYDEKEASLVLKKEFARPFFSISGIYAVSAVGLLHMEEFIEPLAVYFEGNDDLLIEEITEAFSRFQSETLVKTIEPYTRQNYSAISALEVLRQTKHPAAIDVIEESYPLLDSMGKEIAINALTAQFTERAFPLIEDFIEHKYVGGVLEMENIFYSFYQVMDRSHPLMKKWQKQLLHGAEKYRENISATLEQFVSQKKIGRNEPCPCASGKKYKRCCGAN